MSCPLQSHILIISCSKFLFDPFTSLNHVLVSDMDVSSIMFSCMSHSKRKRWKASVCLSALKDGVSRHTFTSSTGCALLSLPSVEVLSIFISAGVPRVFLTLSLMSVPAKQDKLTSCKDTLNLQVYKERGWSSYQCKHPNR